MNWKNELTFWIAAAIVAVLFVAFCAPPPTARAHGDAWWIEKYHKECCGEKDCTVVPARDVRLTKEGWTVREFEGAVKDEDLRQSINDQWWACRGPGAWDIDDIHVEGPASYFTDLRCLFRPRRNFM